MEPVSDVEAIGTTRRRRKKKYNLKFTKNTIPRFSLPLILVRFVIFAIFVSDFLTQFFLNYFFCDNCEKIC